MATKTIKTKATEIEETTAVEETEESLAPSKSKMYLLSALTKDGAAAIAELTKLIGEIGSKVEKSEDLGLKRLAFAINKARQLNLVSVFFLATAQMLNELRAELKHAETVERYLLTDWKADLNAPARRPRRDEVKRDDK